MSLNDPLANTLSHIFNSEKKGKRTCMITPTSRIIREVLRVLKDHHYIGDYQETSTERGGTITVNLLGNVNRCGVIKPRFSLTKQNYERFEKRFLPAKNFGILIMTTSQGIMTHSEALKKGVGGRLLAYCY